MKKTNLLLQLAALIALLTFNGCKDEEEPDVRDQAVGTYTFTAKTYYLDNGQLYDMDISTTGTMVVSKTTSGLEAKSDNEDLFRCVKVTKTQNGFAFDIESDTYQLDGVTVTEEGFDGVTVTMPNSDVIKYHGAYFSDTKKLEAWSTIEDFFVDDEENLYDAVFSLDAKKLN